MVSNSLRSCAKFLDNIFACGSTVVGKEEEDMMEI
jgi:hypothetical protein